MKKLKLTILAIAAFSYAFVAIVCIESAEIEAAVFAALLATGSIFWWRKVLKNV